MTNKQGRKNTTTTGHPDNTHKHTKPISVPHGTGGEGLQDGHPVISTLDTSSQRREHRDKDKTDIKQRHAPPKPSDTAASLPTKTTEEDTEQPAKESGSPSSPRSSGSFGAVNSGSDPMRASTRARTMSMYEMHAPYMS